jgi:hypothetical protein
MRLNSSFIPWPGNHFCPRTPSQLGAPAGFQKRLRDFPSPAADFRNSIREIPNAFPELRWATGPLPKAAQETPALVTEVGPSVVTVQTDDCFCSRPLRRVRLLRR